MHRQYKEGLSIVLAIETVGAMTVRDIREIIYLMRLCCGGGGREIRSISVSASPARLLACLLSSTSRSIIYISAYLHGLCLQLEGNSALILSACVVARQAPLIESTRYNCRWRAHAAKRTSLGGSVFLRFGRPEHDSKGSG